VARTDASLRDLVEQDSIAVLPGCYDALSAKIVRKAGFDAVYLSGAGVSNTRLGLADTGLVTRTEMRRAVETVADAVSVPVFADADEGYGNPMHVRRTVRAYERAGAAGLHVEDQAFPKRCGHFEDKALVDPAEMERKVRAAVDARADDAFLVAARTDARAVEGVEAAIERANRYADAGADLLFPEAPETEAEMRRFCTEIDAPVMANMVEYGKTPLLEAATLAELGFDLVIFPNSLLRAAMQTMVDTAEQIATAGTTADVLDDVADFELRNELTDKERIERIEAAYGEDGGAGDA